MISVLGPSASALALALIECRFRRRGGGFPGIMTERSCDEGKRGKCKYLRLVGESVAWVPLAL